MISRERIPGFERLLWFACRGNVFMRHDPIEDPLEDPVSVSVWVINTLLYVKGYVLLNILHFRKFW